MRADGETLVAMDGKVTLKIFVDRLQKQNRSALVSQEADFIVDHLRQVCEEMPCIAFGHEYGRSPDSTMTKKYHLQRLNVRSSWLLD